MTLVYYDHTFSGLLTAVFEVYERRLAAVHISAIQNGQKDAFAQSITVTASKEKAVRVWKGLQKKLSKEALSYIYKCYLSELPGIEDHLLGYIRYAMRSNADITQDYGHPDVLAVMQTVKKIGREKHRMEAFIRFQLLGDGLYYACISPDFNVLPLILPHFKSRYADQPWLIYDLKRGYGYHYDHHTEAIKEVFIKWADKVNAAKPDKNILNENEPLYQALWKDYFKSTGITERKNMKLHIRHVPRRYWKFLTEKQ